MKQMENWKRICRIQNRFWADRLHGEMNQWSTEIRQAKKESMVVLISPVTWISVNQRLALKEGACLMNQWTLMLCNVTGEHTESKSSSIKWFLHWFHRESRYEKKSSTASVWTVNCVLINLVLFWWLLCNCCLEWDQVIVIDIMKTGGKPIQVYNSNLIHKEQQKLCLCTVSCLETSPQIFGEFKLPK